MRSYKGLNESLLEVELIVAAASTSLSEGKTGLTTANAMTRAGLVLLCGYFEGFIREIVEEYIDILNDRKVSLNDFSEPLFCSVIDGFSEEFRRNSLENFDTLKAIITNNNPAKLNAKALSKTGGNPTVDTVESIFAGLGFKNVIDKITINHYPDLATTFTTESQVDAKFRTSIKSVLEVSSIENHEGLLNDVIALIDQKWQPRKKRRKVGYVTEIEELLKKRNRIAHGEGRQQITPEELTNHKNIVLKLADGLHELAIEAIKITAPEDLQLNFRF
jgi:hypothetical protein